MSSKSETSNRLYVSDISCAGCVDTIKTALASVPGVEDVEVNFATRTATVVGDVEADKLIRAVNDSGYTATPAEDNSSSERENQDLLHYRELLKKTIIAGIIGIIILGVMMLELLPDISTAVGQLSFGVMSLLTLFVLAYAGGRFFSGALKSFRNHSANMDTLIAIGTGVAWLYSTYVVLFPSSLSEIARHVYFDTAIFIIAFIKIPPR